MVGQSAAYEKYSVPVFTFDMADNVSWRSQVAQCDYWNLHYLLWPSMVVGFPLSLLRANASTISSGKKPPQLIIQHP